MPAGLTQQDLIIVIVCSAVGAIISSAILWRCLRSRCRNSTAPLPPVQPLAHHREQQLARLEQNRSSTWYEPALHPGAPFGNFTPGTSKTSLLIPDSPNFTNSGHSASNHDEEMTTLSPLDPNFSITSNNPGPSPPNSVDDVRIASRNAPQSNRRRPMSALSVQSSTRRSIRGAPHAPHNQVQIMLPAPLAPEAQPYLRSYDPSPARSRSVSRYDDGSDHLSLADKWVAPLSRSSSPVRSRKPSGTDEPRRSISSMSSTSHISSGPHVARSASRSPSSRSTPPTVFRPVLASEMPPVPPMPSTYDTHQTERAVPTHDHVRNARRTPTLDVVVPS